MLWPTFGCTTGRVAEFDLAELRDDLAPGHAARRSVRFQDVDAAGIVFYPRILEYLNDALLDFLVARGVRVVEALREQTWALPLRHVEADFLAPLRFGDAIEVAVVRAALEASQVTVGYRVTRQGSQALVAVGKTVHVAVDPHGFHRTELPRPLREVFEPICR